MLYFKTSCTLLVVLLMNISRLLLPFAFLTAATCSTSAAVRLYSSSSSTPETEGAVQICYSGTWYSVCDYSWDCADGNVVCRQLGLGKACECITQAHHNWHLNVLLCNALGTSIVTKHRCHYHSLPIHIHMHYILCGCRASTIQQ